MINRGEFPLELITLAFVSFAAHPVNHVFSLSTQLVVCVFQFPKGFFAFFVCHADNLLFSQSIQ